MRQVVEIVSRKNHCDRGVAENHQVICEAKQRRGKILSAQDLAPIASRVLLLSQWQ